MWMTRPFSALGGREVEVGAGDWEGVGLAPGVFFGVEVDVDLVVAVGMGVDVGFT